MFQSAILSSKVKGMHRGLVVFLTTCLTLLSVGVSPAHATVTLTCAHPLVTTWDTTKVAPSNATIYFPIFAYTGSIDIDWGDSGDANSVMNTGTSPAILGTTTPVAGTTVVGGLQIIHTFSAAGAYTVRMCNADSGVIKGFGTNDTYSNPIGEVSPADNDGWGQPKMLTGINNFGDVGLESLHNLLWCNSCAGNYPQLTEIGQDFPSTVKNVSNMFYGNPTFNLDISGWNTSGVEHFYGMFQMAQAFNNGGQPGIGDWDTGSAISMFQMFANASAFDQDLSNWDVSNVQNFQGTFVGATTFNNGGSAGINNWDTSSATRMFNMFLGATAFNQPLGDWDVSNVTSMAGMFKNATSFNQDLGDWDFGSLLQGTHGIMYYTSANEFLAGGSFTPANYDRLLLAFHANMPEATSLLGGGSSKYTCMASAARAALVDSPQSMVITDSGLLAGNKNYPTLGTVTEGDQQLSIPVTAPTCPGSAADSVEGYEYSSDGGTTWQTATLTSGALVLTGLTNATKYNVQVRALYAGSPAEAGPSSLVASGTPHVTNNGGGGGSGGGSGGSSGGGSGGSSGGSNSGSSSGSSKCTTTISGKVFKNVYFKKGSAKLTKSAKSSLRKIAKTYCKSFKFQVSGYVQSSKNKSNDKTLSKARARAVVKYLKKYGVSGTFVIKAEGKPNNNAKSAKARRVSIHISKLVSIT